MNVLHNKPSPGKEDILASYQTQGKHVSEFEMSSHSKDKILLSIVIISKNEERFIGKCIESVLEATKHIENKEIVLVDSASTDGTLEIAKRYPIKIIRIDSSASLSAAAGRYVGFLHTRGEYIHFQDGDSILYKEWFKNSLSFLEENPDIAGVVGFITQAEYDNLIVKNWIKVSKEERPGDIQYYYADILIKRDVLEKIGPFNPWLRMSEEGELSYRILNAGFKLYRLPYKMCHHLDGENENFYTMIRGKIISAFALGQILRYSLKDIRILAWHIRDSKFIVSTAFVSLLMPIFLIRFYVSGDFRFFYLALTSLLAIYIWIFVEKRDIPGALSHIVNVTFRWPFLIQGFLKRPKKPAEYSPNVAIIKQ